MDRAEFRPEVVLHQEGPFCDVLHSSGLSYRVLRLPFPVLTRFREHRMAMAMAANASTINGYLRANRFGLVHIQDTTTLYLWGLPSHLRKLPILLHWRTNYHTKLILPTLLRLPERIICVSKFAARGLPTRYQHKVEVLTNPFDQAAGPSRRSEARSRLIDELGCSPDTVLLGLFANIAARKRPLIFLEALAESRKQAPGLKFMGLMFGQPIMPLTETVEQHIAQLGLEDVVRLMGFRYPPEEWIAACDIVVAPAINEPFGRSTVEAMLQGTVVVAADSGANPEIIESGVTGILVEPDNPIAFAREIARLASDRSERARLAEQALKSAHKRFSVDAHVRRVTQLYEEISDRRS